MHVSTNGLMVWGIIIILTVSIFGGLLGLTTSGGFDWNTPNEAPSGWDVITGSIDAFTAIMSFSINGAGYLISAFFWLIMLIELWCFIKLIRGTD